MSGPTLSALPQHLELIQPTEAIDAVLDAMAPIVEDWARECMERSGRMLVMMCVLRGGVFFFSDLVQRIGYSVEPAFCRAWSYAKEVTAQPEESVRLEWPEIDLTGRDVVLVDNICDTGRTLARAAAEAWAGEAASVRTVVLAHRRQPRVVHEPTLTGFSYLGRDWLVGYGLRDRGTTMMNARVVARVRDTEELNALFGRSRSPFAYPNTF